MAKKNGNGHLNGNGKVTTEDLRTRLRNLTERMKTVGAKSLAQQDESASLLRDMRTKTTTSR